MLKNSDDLPIYPIKVNLYFHDLKWIIVCIILGPLIALIIFPL